MNPQISQQALKWLNEHDYPFNLYTNQGVFCPMAVLERADKALSTAPSRSDEHFLNIEMLEAYLAKNDVIHFESWADLPEELEIFKFYVFTPDPIKKIEFETFARSLGGLTVTSSFPDNVEISDKNGHKGTGIAAVANHFNIPMKDTVAMGDNFNDLGMLEVAGFAVAMGNAEEEIKQIADVVTLTNDEFGVAHAIKVYVL